MTQIFNKAIYKKLRQKLRNESPSAERVLWQKLRRNQVRGLRFHRQYGINNFVADFYCPEIRLVIELDGGTHFLPGIEVKDDQRNKRMEKLGLKILRFTNTDVYQNINEVMDEIYFTINDLSNNSLTPSNSPFRKGGEKDL
jgi:very-short-patch-repair endonuclease